MLENYERTPSVPDALVIMVKAYRLMQENKLAEDAERVLAQNYPDRAAQLIREKLKQ